MNRLRLFTSLLLVLSAPAFSATTAWHSLADSSSIGWTARWQGTPVKGQFKRFTVTGHIDAAHPAGGRLLLVVDIASVSVASSDLTRALHGAQWFGVANFPQARFTGGLENESKLLILRGILKLKGHDKKIVFPLELTHKNGDLLLQGKFTLERNDFSIGSGQWKSSSMIAAKVRIRFSIRLVPDHSG